MQPDNLQNKMNYFLWVFACLIVFTTASTSQETVLYTFSGGSDGGEPIGNLITDSAQVNLYGVTFTGGDLTCSIIAGVMGCGTVFELSPNGSGGYTESVLYRFTGVNGDGAGPSAGLVFDGAGNLYGTTQLGGSPNDNGQGGTAFMLSPPASGNGLWKETILYSFCNSGNCSDGSEPESSLTFDSQGNLYGTTNIGGHGVCYFQGCGVVFELSPKAGGGYTETVLHNFTNIDGPFPISGVIIDSKGNLFGTSFYGGATATCNPKVGYVPFPSGCGLVYELTLSPGHSWSFEVIHTFTGFDGAFPGGELIEDSAGNLYGTTESGGLVGPCIFLPVNGCGTVFEVSPNGQGGYTESVLYRFAGGLDGEMPSQSVSMDSSGNLYGTTLYGGGQHCFIGCGTAFELVPQSVGGWQEINLNSFGGSNGTSPESGLLLKVPSKKSSIPPRKSGCIGNCYGTCFTGGAGSGVLYSLE